MERVLKGENAGEIFEEVHADWYLALFDPSAAAGIVKQSDLLMEEENPAVRVILGHFIFVYIHPYSDGNDGLRCLSLGDCAC